MRLAQELERSQSYLSKSSRKPLIACIEFQLVDQHFSSILDQGFASMVKEHRVEDLTRLYTLTDRVGRLQDLKKAFSGDIKKVGETLVMDPQKVFHLPTRGFFPTTFHWTSTLWNTTSVNSEILFLFHHQTHIRVPHLAVNGIKSIRTASIQKGYRWMKLILEFGKSA